MKNIDTKKPGRQIYDNIDRSTEIDVDINDTISEDRVKNMLDSLIVYEHPVPAARRGRESLYHAFLGNNLTKPGQCIYLTDESIAKKLFNASNGYGKKHNQIFTLRKIVPTPGSNVKYGLWRLK